MHTEADAALLLAEAIAIDTEVAIAADAALAISAAELADKAAKLADEAAELADETAELADKAAKVANEATELADEAVDCAWLSCPSNCLDTSERCLEASESLWLTSASQPGMSWMDELVCRLCIEGGVVINPMEEDVVWVPIIRSCWRSSLRDTILEYISKQNFFYYQESQNMDSRSGSEKRS